MSVLSQLRWRRFCIIAAVLAVFVGVPAAQAASPKPKPPRKVYLAMGDSLAFGYQEAKVIANLPIPARRCSTPVTWTSSSSGPI